jgi:hypothetical protein
MEQHLMDFNQTVSTFKQLSETAKVTLFKRLLDTVDTPQTLRTVVRYSCINLDRINSKLPEGSPGKERYRKYVKQRSRRQNTETV